MHCMCGITAWTALLALLPVVQCADVVACPPAVAGCVDGGEMPRVRVFYMQWPVCCFCFLIFPFLLPLISNFILFPFFCFYSPSSSCITQMRQIPPNSQEPAPCHPIRYPRRSLRASCMSGQHAPIDDGVSPRLASFQIPQRIVLFARRDSHLSLVGQLSGIDRNGPMQLGGGCWSKC